MSYQVTKLAFTTSATTSPATVKVTKGTSIVTVTVSAGSVVPTRTLRPTTARRSSAGRR